MARIVNSQKPSRKSASSQMAPGKKTLMKDRYPGKK